MDWTQTWTVIGAVSGVIALQSFWISRVLERIEHRFDVIDRRFDGLEENVVRDHAERIARLGERGRS